MDFDFTYIIEKEIDEKTFLRQLLIELAVKSDTPVDIVDATFGKIKEGLKEVIVCTASVEGTCTASVGHDRQEPYVTYERYRKKVGSSYVSCERPVTKYKTVTDWTPFQTQYSGESTCATYNFDEFCVDDDYIITAITTANKSNISQTTNAFLDSSGLSNALLACQHDVERTSVKLPGDRQERVNFNSRSQVKKLTCFKLPYYELTYKYHGKSYTATCFACGDISIDAETPKNDINITDAVNKKTKKFKTRKNIAWIIFALALIVAEILCYKFNFPWLWPIAVAFLITAKKSNEKYINAYLNCSNLLSKDIAQSKLDALNTALKKHNLTPVGKRLSNNFDGSSIPGAKDPKGFKCRLVISWILTIILIVQSVFSSITLFENFIYSDQHIDVKITEKTQYYDPDASPYINGCYYIDIKYEISSKLFSIDYIDMEINVTDKDGNELGMLTSSVSDLQLTKGEKTTVTSVLEENMPEENEFFVILYQSDLSDLNFEYEINSVKFKNGDYHFYKK